MIQNSLQQDLRNVEASLNMEGLTVSDANKELCTKLLQKEISFEEYMKIILQNAKVTV